MRTDQAGAAGDDAEFEEALRGLGLQMETPDDPVAESAEVCEVHPNHLQALNLFMTCQGQLQPILGGMGGAHWRAAQTVNVLQEAKWQGLFGPRQAVVAGQYRLIEREALRILNEREAQAAKG